MELDFQQNSVKFKVIKWLKDAQRYETMLKMEFDVERDSAESRVKKWLEDLHLPKTVIDLEPDEEYDSPQHKVVTWLQGVQTYSSGKINSSCVSDLSNDSVGENSTSFESSDSMSLSEEGCRSSNPQIHEGNYDASVGNSSESSRCSVNLVRRPYVYSERMSIIDYIVKHNLYQQVKGNMLWQKMENNKVCSRSWQSMKSHFLNYILPNIDNFPLSDRIRKSFKDLSTMTCQKESAIMQPYQRGWREKVNYYTFAEDIDLLRYILHRHRYKRTHGKSLWIKMCKRKLLPGRSWQSLRSRFFTILPYLSTYKLKQEDINRLLSPSVNSKSPKKTGNTGSLQEDRLKSIKKKLNYMNKETEMKETLPEVSPAVAVSKNVKEKQEIAKMALSTGIALAAQMQSNKSCLVSQEFCQNKHVHDNCKTLEKLDKGNYRNPNASSEINELNAGNLDLLITSSESDGYQCNATLSLATITDSSKEINRPSKETSLLTCSYKSTQNPDEVSFLLTKSEGILHSSCSFKCGTLSKLDNISVDKSNSTIERQSKVQTSQAECEDVAFEIENMYDEDIVLCWESGDSDIDV